MFQLQIEFPQITIQCDHCQKPTGISPRNENMFDGFIDADNSKFICWRCQVSYYKWKQGDAEGTTFSEMPATLQTIKRINKSINQ